VAHLVFFAVLTRCKKLVHSAIAEDFRQTSVGGGGASVSHAFGGDGERPHGVRASLTLQSLRGKWCRVGCGLQRRVVDVNRLIAHMQTAGESVN